MARTATIIVSLPRLLEKRVDGTVGAGGYGSASEYVRGVLEKLERDEQHRKIRAALTAKLLEGLDSGAAIPFDAGHVEAKKAPFVRRSVRHKSASRGF